ncbi:HD-GYP domain-containing protein [Ciceribacter sp. L1K22]|uniref:HD-GYP domain-containing protein n=1 Tax=Ciceribacter sp. L1K22 TaxID=2820275 RepID=UPI001ABE0B79|nr:HD-GYP domain-containing protein [Ciceribacter sp. L1K22]MBO3760213.1 HD-GYP domain-containing protein [Ciceribacter sp. L1K22]
MKKRIHLHQLRPGMYVEEIEARDPKAVAIRQHFLINSMAELKSLLACKAMSAVIDVSKGVDIDGAAFPRLNRAEYEAGLIGVYSKRQINRAKAAIAETVPHVRDLLRAAQADKAFDAEGAGIAIDAVMMEAVDNAAAMISLLKLKEKDEGTFLHSLSVSALMITFGRTLGLDEDTVRSLGLGGLVHDIGKMAIPKGVLKKNSSLNDNELAIIRSHPERGYRMLARTEGLSTEVLDICRFHHEKFDGSGYPQGLRGEAIPYASRIAAICDVYDALTTVRPYKRAWTQAEAVERMLQAHGHFDPDLIKRFVSRMVVNGTIN